MNRLDFERNRGRRRFRLTLEHLESRRLMAGLDVLVFTDQDGSRSLNSAVDVPAASRLVYIDSNHSGSFDDSDPLAISGDDGVASFSNLEAGDYLIGLAELNPAQLQTTSVVSDSLASVAAQASTQDLITSGDLKQAWSISASGRVTPLGSDEAISEPFELGGPIVSSTKTAFGATGQSAAWALVDNGSSQAALVRLDLAAGEVRQMTLEGVPDGYRAIGVARMGEELALQLQSSHDSRVGLVTVGEDAVSVVNDIAIPRGKLVGTSVPNQLAVIGFDNALSVASIRIVGDAAIIQNAVIGQAIQSAELSPDGKYLFATHVGGGLEVFSVGNGLRSAAYLAEASGPVAVSSRDGRVVTANASNPHELIVWDPAAAWQPVSRVALPSQSGPVSSLAIDQYGDGILAATADAVLDAALAKPSLMPVHVAEDGTTEASFGVRMIDQPAPLPDLLEIALSVAEDDELSLDLSSLPALAVLGSAPLVWQAEERPQLGTLNVLPSGRLTYKPDPNANGKDATHLKVFNGVSSSTLVISLNVTAVNDPPDGFSVDPVSIPEASAAGVSAGFATVFDVDADARYLITTSDPRFFVVNGQLVLSGLGQLDYETEPVVQLDVTATDLDNPQFALTRQVEIPVLDSNDGPISLGVLAAAVAENVSGAAVGQVQVSDPDTHGQYVFSVSDDRFEVTDGQLRLKDGQQLNYESEPQVTVTVTVRDPSAEIGTAAVATTVVVDVLDRNDAPTNLFVDAVRVKEHDPGVFVGTVNVIDEDALDQFSFDVSDSRFVVEGNALRLKEGEALQDGDGPLLPIVVSATDRGGNVVSKTVSISVINDAPYQNPDNPYDVDNDGEVYPRDVLILINLINQSGPHVIEPLSSGGEGDNPMQGVYVDVNGDGSLTAIDVLLLINQLNQNTSAALSDPGSDSPWSPPVTSPVGGVSTDGSPSLPVQSPEDYNNVPGSTSSTGQTSLPPAEGEAWDSTLERRAAIDAELETLLDELSRERLR